MPRILKMLADATNKYLLIADCRPGTVDAV